MGGPGDLYRTAREFLAACEEAVATSPAGPIPPGFVFVSPGLPAFDCCDPGQLTVHVGGPAEADTLPISPPLAVGHRDVLSGSVHLINMTATVLRCTPTVRNDGEVFEFPAPAAIDASAEQVLGDLWAIWNVVRAKHREHQLFMGASQPRELFFDPAVAVNPAGGCAGFQVGIRVRLDGYGG